MKNLFLALFLISSVFLKSQSYQPVISPGKQFNISWGPPMLGVDGYGYYFFDGDTVINNTTYSKLMGYSNCRGCTLPSGKYTLYLAALLREDRSEEKVYKYYGLPQDSFDTARYGQEHLLYDFSLKAGDTVEMFNQHSGNYETLAIDSVTDRILTNGDTAQDFHTNLSFTSNTILYSSNIINSYYSFDMMMAGFLAEFDCVFGQNAQVVYQSTSANCNPSTYINIEESDLVNSYSIKLYPNPAGEKFTFKSDTDGLLKLFDLQGQLVLELDIIKPEQVISVTQLKGGIYFWLFENGETNMSGKLQITTDN